MGEQDQLSFQQQIGTESEKFADNALQSTFKKTKKGEQPAVQLPVHVPFTNQQRIVYYQNQIRNMQLFCDEADIVQKAEVSEAPYQIDLLQVHNDRVYVASAEKQISVFNIATFTPVQGDKKIETSEQIRSLAFYSNKIYVGEANKTLEIFSQTTLDLTTKMDTRADITSLLTIPNCGLLIGQEDGYLDLLSLYQDSILV